MSDSLNDDDDDFDSLAAEYVLGTLEADERTRANVLLDVDEHFRAQVRLWERRLGELHLMVEPVEPDRQIWERIGAKVGPGRQPSPAPAPPPPPPPQAAAASELERQIEADLAGTAEPAIDPVAELERALEQVRAQETERMRAAPPPEPAVAIKTERLPEPARTSAPESVPRGPPAPPPLPEPLVPEPPAPAGGPRVVALEARRPLLLTEEQVAPSDTGRRRLRRWRLAAMFMTLLVALLGGLISAWRYVPERLPPQLRPTAVLNLPDMPALPPKKVAPPGSEFDE